MKSEIQWSRQDGLSSPYYGQSNLGPAGSLQLRFHAHSLGGREAARRHKLGGRVTGPLAP